MAICQMSCSLDQLAENLNKIQHYIKIASECKCDYVIFPEMVDTGYDLQNAKAISIETYNRSISVISKSAAEFSLGVFCGICERSNDGKLYNTITCFDNQGFLIGSYRKVHLFTLNKEEKYFEPGQSLALCQIENIDIGLMICYDLRFPEHARKLILSGAKILLICAAWPKERIEHLLLLAKASAVENQCFVLLANRVGTDDNLTFGGSSCFIAPDGEVLEQASVNEESLISYIVDWDYLTKIRNRISVFDDRREELYSQDPVRIGRI